MEPKSATIPGARSLDDNQVLPGSGPVAVTTRVTGIAPGQWHATATSIQDRRPRGALCGRATAAETAQSVVGRRDQLGPVHNVMAPGVRLGAWPAVVAAGTVLALSVQALLAAHAQLPALRVLVVWLIACLASTRSAGSRAARTGARSKFGVRLVPCREYKRAAPD